jgi:hypothetical protein
MQNHAADNAMNAQEKFLQELLDKQAKGELKAKDRMAVPPQR